MSGAKKVALMVVVAIQGCVLDYDALRSGGEGSDAADAGPTDDGGRLEAGLPDRGLPDLGLPDLGLPDLGLPDLGVPAPDTGPRPDAGGDQQAWPEILTPCPTSWSILDQDYFDGALSGWSSDGTFEAGHAWRTESGALLVDMDGSANYWDRHLVRDGFSAIDFAVMVDFSAHDEESWPQVHLRVDPARPTERFYGIRLNSTREDLQLAVQTVADNADNPEENSSFPAIGLGETVRLVAQIRNDGPDVVVRAGLYGLGDELIEGSIVTHRYTGATAYTAAGGVAVSGWVGRTRFEHVRMLGCR